MYQYSLHPKYSHSVLGMSGKADQENLGPSGCLALAWKQVPLSTVPSQAVLTDSPQPVLLLHRGNFCKNEYSQDKNAFPSSP